MTNEPLSMKTLFKINGKEDYMSDSEVIGDEVTKFYTTEIMQGYAIISQDDFYFILKEMDNTNCHAFRFSKIDRGFDLKNIKLNDAIKIILENIKTNPTNSWMDNIMMENHIFNSI